MAAFSPLVSWGLLLSMAILLLILIYFWRKFVATLFPQGK
jgi:hypothetical protein